MVCRPAGITIDSSLFWGFFVLLATSAANAQNVTVYNEKIVVGESEFTGTSMKTLKDGKSFWTVEIHKKNKRADSRGNVAPF